MLRDRDEASDDTRQDTDAEESEHERRADRLEIHDDEHLEHVRHLLRHDGVDRLDDKERKDSGDRADQNSFDDEGKRYEPLRRTDVSHYLDLFLSRGQSELDRVHDYEQADYEEDRKEPDEDHHNGVLEILDLLREVVSVVDLSHALQTVQLVDEIGDLRVVGIRYFEGVGKREEREEN